MASAKSKYIFFFHTSRITSVCISINIYYPILWRKTVACSKYNSMQALRSGVCQQLFVKLFISVTNEHTFVCLLFSAIISEFIVQATNKY